MLAWIMYGLGLALVAAGVTLSIWRRRPYANGLVALGNVALVGCNLLRDQLGFAVFHLAIAVASLALWIYLAIREEA